MMSFSGLCQYFSEITLYLATVRFVFTIIGDIQAPWPVAGIFLVAGIISAFFSRFKGFAAYLPLVLVLPAFFMAKSAADIVCLVPLAGLLFFHIYRKRWNCDGVVLLGSLKAGLLAFVFIVLFAAVGTHMNELKREAIPMLVLFMSLVILGLRVLRNEEMGKTGPLFYLLNTAVVALVAASGFLFSNSWLLNSIKTVFKLFYDKVLGPILMGLTYVVIILPMALGWLLDKIELKEPEPFEEVLENVFSEGEYENLIEDAEYHTTPEWIPKLFTALGILLFLFICFLVIRKLVDTYSQRQPSGGKFTRTSIDEEAPRRRRHVHRNSSDDAIRTCYRKYLDICEDFDIPVDGTLASDEIATYSGPRTGEEPTAGLRRIWLPARYSENVSTDEDARKAKQYLKEIKRKVKE